MNELKTSQNSSAPIALVTGASSGIGNAISLALLAENYRVIGVSRSITKAHAHNHTNFLPLPSDLTNLQDIENLYTEVKKRFHRLDLLVNCAGIGVFGPHETLKPKDLATMVQLNITAPLLLTRFFLRMLKETQGTIVNISSTAAQKIHAHGCAYAATKAALSHFGASLAEETRKSKVRVITLHPDMTQTNFYHTADFEPENTEDTVLTPENVVNAVLWALNQPPHVHVLNLSLRPAKLGIRRKTAIQSSLPAEKNFNPTKKENTP